MRGQSLRLMGVALLISACGGGGGGSTSTGGGGNPIPPPSNTILVGTSGYSDPYGGGDDAPIFNPSTLTVAAGTTVTWSFRAAGHALESGNGCAPDGRFSSGGVKASGYTMTYTFTTPGTYPFYCTTHCGQNMKGTVTVQ